MCTVRITWKVTDKCAVKIPVRRFKIKQYHFLINSEVQIFTVFNNTLKLPGNLFRILGKCNCRARRVLGSHSMSLPSHGCKRGLTSSSVTFSKDVGLLLTNTIKVLKFLG